MNYQPFSHDFVVENPEQQTFFVNREVFVSDDVLEREKRRIFDRCWVYVGHASELKNPGDFKTRPVAGRPIIFCRDRDGEVHALINSCRHRGALVCREREGNARQFYCMYHGWTYHTGRPAQVVPGEDAYGAALRQGRRWASSPVPRLESYRDFYFANFDRDAIDLDDLSRQAPRTTSISSSTSRRPARCRSSPARRNTTSGPTGSSWSRTASTIITWSPRIRPGSTTCAIPASTSRRRRASCCRRAAPARDLGNGHLTTDNPNYRGRPVARWISVYGEDAKADIDAHAQRAGAAARLGARRPRRRHQPQSRDLSQSRHQRRLVGHGAPLLSDRARPACTSPPGRSGPVEETEAQRARRLHAFLTFYGPGGFATPDDVAALEAAQLGFAAWREVPWSDLSRGMGKASDEQLATDEGHLRVFWRRWSELMEARRMNEVVTATVSRAEVEDLFYHEADLLDDWRLDEWLTLLDRRRDLLRAAERQAGCRRTASRCSPSPTTCVRLRERVIRLKDPNCHAEYPLSRTRRLIGNVRITGVDGDEISAAANFIIHRFRHNDLLARVRRPLPLQAPPRRRPAEDRRTPRHPRCRGAGPAGLGEFYFVMLVIPGPRQAREAGIQ